MKRSFDIVCVVIALLGLAALVANGWAWLDIVNSPGDDNPVALMVLLLGGMSLLPVSGPLWVRRMPTIVRALWTLASLVPIAFTALLFSAFFSR